MSINKDIEEEFVQTFLIKQSRERALFELGSKKKRINFFSKLCHNFDQILDDRFLEAAHTSLDSDIYKLLKSHGAPENCYVMSYIAEFDAQTILLSDALHKVVGLGMPSIVLCIPGKLAYFETEQEKGAPPRYLLKPERNTAQ